MDFGLGLVLSFTDNATAGINNAVNSLNQLTRTAEDASQSVNQMASLSALSVVSGQIGNSFTSMGYSIISTLGQVVSKVNETGQTLMFAENQLDKLYEGSGKSGAQVVGQIQDYAKKTIFEFEDLISVVTNLKSVGIEAFDEIASSAGKTYDLMGLAADLAAFNPNMMNMYGTGINAAMGALKEYVAEGNALSLKRGAGLDITQILGEDKGKTIEERSRQVADLLEKLNMVGMTTNLENTPMTRLSNMQDTLFQFLGKISSSGAYDAFNNLIYILSEYVSKISDSELDALAKSISGGIEAMLKPLQTVLKVLLSFVDKIRTLLAENPELAKFAIIGASIGGVLLILTGVFLKVTSALSGLSLMLLASGQSFKTMGGFFKTGSLKMLGVLLPLMATIGLIALAWKSDFLGIKTNVTNFVSNLMNSFRTADNAVDGSVSNLMQTISRLKEKDDFFSNLTLAIMKVKGAIEVLSDAWNDDTISEENYLKMKYLGIEPLVSAILDLKYRFGFFKKGFIEGWKEINKTVTSVADGISKGVKGTIFEKFLDNITKFFELLSNNDPKAWESTGKAFSKIAFGLFGIAVALKLFKGVSKIFGAGRSIGGFIGRILGHDESSGGSSSTSGGLLSNPTKVVKTLGSVALIIGGVSLLVLALGALMSVPHFSEFMSKGAEVIVSLFSVLVPLASSVVVIGLLVKALDTLKVNPSKALKGMADFAIILGGLELILIAMGALASIPYFSDFISNGASVFKGIAEVLDVIFSPEIIASVLLISGFGIIPIPTVLSGLANLALVLGGLTALIVAFGALSKIEGFNQFIENGGDTIALLFKQVGKIAGAIIGGFGESISDSLPVIGENLSIFADRLTPFLNMIKNSPTASTITDFTKSFVNFLKEMVGEKSRSKKIKDVGNNIAGLSEDIDDLVLSMNDFIGVNSVFTNSFNTMKDSVVSNSSTMTTAISNMVTSVTSNLNTLKSSFSNLKLELPKVKVPHFKVLGNFNLETKQVPKIDVKWYKTGGIFNNPSLIGVGEAGSEAVVPLENNTGWLSRIAEMLSDEMQSITPTNTKGFRTSGDSSNGYIPTNNNTTSTVYGDTDNSVVFDKGAIQVIVQNATEAEAMKLAKMVMEYIKRQKELDKMVRYAT